EDGIRDFHVTGVQTCALPISRPSNEPAITPRTWRKRPATWLPDAACAMCSESMIDHSSRALLTNYGERSLPRPKVSLNGYPFCNPCRANILAGCCLSTWDTRKCKELRSLRSMREAGFGG